MKGLSLATVVAAFGLNAAQAEAKPVDPQDRQFRAEQVRPGEPIQVQRACLAKDLEPLRADTSIAIRKAVAKQNAELVFQNLDLRRRALLAYALEYAEKNYGPREERLAEYLEIINNESGWKSTVRSDTTAVGLGQFVPTTFARVVKNHKGAFEEILCEDLPNPARMSRLYKDKFKDAYNRGWTGPDEKEKPIEAAKYKAMKSLMDIRENDGASFLAIAILTEENHRTAKANKTQGYNYHLQGVAGWNELTKHERAFEADPNSDETRKLYEGLSWHQKEHTRAGILRRKLNARGFDIAVGQLRLENNGVTAWEMDQALATYDAKLAEAPDSETQKLVAKIRLMSSLGAEVLSEPDYAYPYRFTRGIRSKSRAIERRAAELTAAHNLHEIAFADFQLVDKIGPTTGEIIAEYVKEQEAKMAKIEAEKTKARAETLKPIKEESKWSKPVSSPIRHLADLNFTRRDEDGHLDAADAHHLYDPDLAPTQNIVQRQSDPEFHEFLKDEKHFTAILELLEADFAVGKKIAKYNELNRSHDWNRVNCLRDVLHDLEDILEDWEMSHIESRIRDYQKDPSIAAIRTLDYETHEPTQLEAARVHEMNGEYLPAQDLPEILEDLCLADARAGVSWASASLMLENSPYASWVQEYKDYGSKLDTLGDFFENIKAAVEEEELILADLQLFQLYIEENFPAKIGRLAKPRFTQQPVRVMESVPFSPEPQELVGAVYCDENNPALEAPEPPFHLQSIQPTPIIMPTVSTLAPPTLVEAEFIEDGMVQEEHDPSETFNFIDPSLLKQEPKPNRVEATTGNVDEDLALDFEISLKKPKPKPEAPKSLFGRLQDSTKKLFGQWRRKA